MIIPHIQILKSHIQTKAVFDGLLATKKLLLESIDNYFKTYTDNPSVILAMFLNPRYKNECFKDVEKDSLFHIDSIKRYLINAYDFPEDNETHNNDLATIEPSANEVINESPKKNTSIFDRGHTEIIKASLTPKKLPSVSESIMHEVDIYTTTSPTVISKNECPFTWWETNQLRLPKLSKLAARFLSAPPSSVESERLFSVGGQIYTPRRNRLAAETGKKLMFLNFNLKWLKGNSKI